MTFPAFGANELEPSRQVGFAGNIIDRQSENRSDDATEIALADPQVRIMLMRGGRLYLRFQNGHRAAQHSLAEARDLGAKLQHGVLLGHHDGMPLVAAPAGVDPDDLPDDIKAIDFRSIMVQDLLEPEGLGALAQGASLLAWHNSHRHCGRCGAETEIRAGGYKRKCPSCEAEHFPRTDPVVIMLTVDGDRCLMGRGYNFPPGVYSCLAGFVEPGETIEDAVRRETFEESGVRIGRVAYHASQPWPFPHTLMIGCYGEAVSTELNVDKEELEDCRWFSRQEVQAAMNADEGDIRVPPSGAIAWHIIKAWAEAN